MAIKINGEGDVKPGSYRYSKAIIAVTDRLFKPEWWAVNDRGNETYFENTVEKYYLGTYSVEKYKMFLKELIKDDVVFDGKDMQVIFARKRYRTANRSVAEITTGKNRKEPATV